MAFIVGISVLHSDYGKWLELYYLKPEHIRRSPCTPIFWTHETCYTILLNKAEK
jgi:hypothetical protein